MKWDTDEMREHWEKELEEIWIEVLKKYGVHDADYPEAEYGMQ